MMMTRWSRAAGLAAATMTGALGVLGVSAGACRSYYLTDDIGGEDAAPAADGNVGARPHRIYVYGGSNDGVTLPTEPIALVAEIQPDGLLGSWQAAPPPPKSMIWHMSAHGEDVVVLLGGIARPDGPNRAISRGAVVDGQLTGFATVPGVLPDPIYRGAAAVRGKSLYVMGGESGDQQPATAIIWRSEIAGGSFGPLTRVGTLPAPVSKAGVAEAPSGDLYLVGGMDQNFAGTSTILRASFAADSAVPVVSVAGALPSPRFYAAAVVSDRALLAIGGELQSDTASVLRCPLDAAGTVGACVETAPLPAPRARHRALIHEGRVYVLGGSGTSVVVGSLDGSGNVERWQVTTPLPIAAVFGEAFVL